MLRSSRHIPPEILHNIFSHLSLCDLLLVSQVNSTWQGAAMAPQLWRSLTLDLATITDGAVSMNVERDPKRKRFMRLTPRLVRKFEQGFKSIPMLASSSMTLSDRHLLDALRFTGGIRHVNLMGCANIRSDTLFHLIHSCKQSVQSINFSGVLQVSDDLLAYIGNTCVNLESIDLSLCTKTSASSICKLIKARASSLASLTLQKMLHMNDEDMLSIVGSLANCRNITRVDLSRNDLLIDVNILDTLCHNLAIGRKDNPSLTRVEIVVLNCERLVQREIIELQEKHPFARVTHNAQLYDYSIESVRSFLDLLVPVA